MEKVFWIDLFSGAGGTTTGIHLANMENVKVVACVNHDRKAIESHAANHPDCMHLVEDVRDFKVVVKLRNLVKTLRSQYPDCFINLWASLECTNFSKAKGGLPRDADSRTLAHALYMYVEELNPDYIYIENVREFMAWGPLDEKGKPISRLNGEDYLKWKNAIKSYGYEYDKDMLNAADFGAFTSRERYFGIFAKNDLPITWPEPTHSKNPSGKNLKKWKPVKEVLDLEDEGNSIFTRKKPLVDATLERIYAGLIKFVAGGEEAFMVKYNSMNRNGHYKAPDISEPCPVVSTQNRLAVAKCSFIQKYYSGRPAGKVKSLDHPAGTITCIDGQSLVTSNFLTSYYGNGGAHPVDEPCPTLTTKDRFTSVKPQFLLDYQYKCNAHTIDKPSPTLLTKDKFAKVFIDQQYGQSRPISLLYPVGTLTANPKFNLVTVLPWLMSTHFNNIGNDLEGPAPVVTANRKWPYLLNPQFQDKGRSLDKPCFTLIARMDKRPPSLVQPVEGNSFVQIQDSDTPSMIKIKEFMMLYGIVDIKMRMLKIPELLKIQGFPEDYELKGTQADQKKFIGNAVVPHVARALAKDNAGTILLLGRSIAV